MKLSKADLARYIEYVILKPEGTRAEVIKLCEEAVQYNFITVCLHPCYVSLAKSICKGTPVKVMTPAGFPFGANTTGSKVFEAQDAVKNGADEIDMMMFMGAFKDKLYDAVVEDIKAVVRAVEGRVLKVIIETALLSREEKIKACQLAMEAGAHFVKTSTGNALPGATVEDIRLMRQTVGPNFGVKASGGITKLSDTLAFIEAGANRVASRVAVDIMNEWKE
ncbi:MAG: deoxyribose-phosphate aldolase [candidate division NC10 bacterium]|nr:deoxyribose-phosphate aldolase [candidate division NC10 bacterium]